MSNLKKVIDFAVKLALIEDVGRGDVTTRAIVPSKLKATGAICAKEDGVVAGLIVAKEVFAHVDKKIKFTQKVRDGAAVKKGTIIVTVSGPARGIVTGERVALNFLQHLSGIATLTRKFVSSAANNKVKILDTRKTTPGLRLLEKYAVRMGDGANHRLGLYDAILIKDNHIKIAGSITAAIEAVSHRRGAIEIETTNLSEVAQAIKAGVRRVLLDNMTPAQMKRAVELCKKAGVKTEASGGVSLTNIAAIVRTGVDYISIGELTHSAKALDINLKITKP